MTRADSAGTEIHVERSDWLAKSVSTRPPSWPPPDDFPVVRDDDGNVISRFGDGYWDVTPWCRTARRLSFDQVSSRRRAVPLSKENAIVFKHVIATWLYGPNRVLEPSTLVGRYELLRPLFVLCTQQRISAARLWRFPKIIDMLGDALAPARAREVLYLLHELYMGRRQTGLIILMPEQLSQLATSWPRHQRAQTAYIPPRIWMYMMQRCKAAIEDFLAHADQVEALFHFAVEAYRANLKPGSCLYRDGVVHGREPFTTPLGRRGERSGVVIHGPFEDVAARFGVKGLISKWNHGDQPGRPPLKISDLSKLLTLVELCAQTYLASFALTRVEETGRLRAGCIEKRSDPSGKPIVLLRGRTTKTVQEATYWIGSDFCESAVVAMERMSLLRINCAVDDPRTPVTVDDIPSRPLDPRAYEPWTTTNGDRSAPLDVRPGAQAYCGRLARCSFLFDADQMRVRPDDFEVARSITPTLDPKKFQIGRPWPLSWHQLRRTGAVNMHSSGLVSDTSLQLQLKHSSEAMTHYYAQGYYHLDLVLDESSRKEYLNALYERVGKEMEELQTSTYVSPYGSEHKQSILKLISDKDHKSLVAMAKRRSIPYRETLLGACASPTPCSYGGADSLIECVGRTTACPYALIDQAKFPRLLELQASLKEVAKGADPTAPKTESIEAQIAAIEAARKWIA